MKGKLAWLIVLCLLASIQLAQAQPRMYSVGLLSLGTTVTAEVQGLRDGLKAAGYVEGKNLLFAVGVAKTYDELRPVAQSFVEKNFDVIVSTGASAPLIAKQSTQIIPIVFVGGADPVQVGLVKSLGHPESLGTGTLKSTENGLRFSRKLCRICEE